MTPGHSDHDGLARRSHAGRDAPDFILQRAHEQNVATIELWVTDALGALHVIEVPRESLEDVLADGFFAGPSLAKALSPTGERAELYLAPDPMSYQQVSRQRRAARLICEVQLADGTPWPLCVRSRLKRALGRIAADSATFYLGATSTVRWLSAPLVSAPLVAPQRQQQLAEETVRGLDALSIPWRSHRRVAGEPRDPSSWLFELDLVDPLTLADSIVALRRLAEVAAHCDGAGLTWMPYPWEGVSRATFDLSLTRLSSIEGPAATFSDPLHGDGLSLTARAVARALRAELGPLSVILRSTVDSYLRLDPVAIEASPMSRTDSGAALWVAGADASANPYLVAATLISIAHLGALEAPGRDEANALRDDSGRHGRDEARGHGANEAEEATPETLPETLVEAARLAEGSSVLVEVLGPELLNGLVTRARADATG